VLGNLGPWEIILILLVVLLVFGAKRLPEMGAAMGKGIREFKKNITEVKDSINAPDEPASRSLSGSAERNNMTSPSSVDEREPKKLSE
jgi:sec-independent protein translocase protein TatA